MSIGPVWPILVAVQLGWQAFVFQTTEGARRQIPAERAFLEVLENRDDPSSRKIRLNVVRFRSTAVRPAAPIVFLAGGPISSPEIGETVRAFLAGQHVARSRISLPPIPFRR